MIMIPLLICGVLLSLGGIAVGWYTPSRSVALVLILAGVFVAVLGFRSDNKVKKRIRDIEWLKSHGKREKAVITHISQVTLKWQSYLLVTCKWADKAARLEYTYTSDPIWDSPANGMVVNGSVDVLIDPANPLRNYIDVTAYSLKAYPISASGTTAG